VVRPGGHVCLLDVIFPSAAARMEAERAHGPYWDRTESYPLVWELDGLLREAGFEAIRWHQTGPYHWAVAGRRAGAAATPAMVETDRLWLTPAPLKLVQAVSEGRRTGLRFPARVLDAWPDADLRDFLPTYAAMLEEEPLSSRWGVWVMIEKATDTIIGDIGFKGSPDEAGRVEIGYSILPDWRRQGFAAEAARALVHWALTQPGVTAVQAECLPDNTGSVRVLETAGLQQVGREGDLLKWIVTR
jgi:ribosomal-protein-alanine N-acetyltransferase